MVQNKALHHVIAGIKTGAYCSLVRKRFYLIKNSHLLWNLEIMALWLMNHAL